MIEFVKMSKKIYCMRMDLMGLNQMIGYIENLKEKQQMKISYWGKEKKFSIEVVEDRQNLLITTEEIRIDLDKDEIEYMKQRLNNAVTNGIFYPAEWREKIMKNKLVSMYIKIV